MSVESRHAGALRELHVAVNAVWRLGRNMVVAWSYSGSTVYLCVVPTYVVFETSEEINYTFDKGRLRDEETFLDLCKGFGARPTRIELDAPIGKGKGEVPPSTIERMLRRYSVTHTPHRAVMLFDIVGFSKASPIEQVAQLNSLEYSINSAEKRLQALGLDVELARSTVGDGFYVWNRRQGLEAELRTYLALQLILLDNKRAQRKGGTRFVPVLRTVFSIGSHYSYHQVEGQSPRGFEYIVGDITISLARLISKAEAHQLLIGNFERPVDRAKGTVLDAPLFLARAVSESAAMEGLEFGREPIRSVHSFITGTDLASGRQSVNQYTIKDKHGFAHPAFNVVLQARFDSDSTLTIGLGTDALTEFDADADPYRIDIKNLARMRDLFRA
ncbi:hypothetical protein [Thalassobaculum sp.]|uniref:hypothetical protein n=1 Tax=Thalassobaculum sp. TaxID=2022740 RepID=UPI0032EDE164